MNLTRKRNKSLFAFHSCHQGESHKKMGKVCQDAAYSRFRDNDHYAVAIVSDGHGSDNYFRSDKGSKFAVEAAQEAIGGFMQNFIKESSSKNLFNAIPFDELMCQLEKSIICKWQTKIKEDCIEKPFTEEEIALMTSKFREEYEANPKKYCIKPYGATLIAVVIYPDHFWFGLHIGDGKCVAQHANGKFDQPIPWDDRCFLNVTTSLCDEYSLERFRHCFHKGNFPTAIFVGSDGVDDCFANDDDLYGFYREVIQTFQEQSYKKAEKEINDFLPDMSARGSGDDISISGIINI